MKALGILWRTFVVITFPVWMVPFFLFVFVWGSEPIRAIVRYVRTGEIP